MEQESWLHTQSLAVTRAPRYPIEFCLQCTVQTSSLDVVIIPYRLVEWHRLIIRSKSSWCYNSIEQRGVWNWSKFCTSCWLPWSAPRIPDGELPYPAFGYSGVLYWWTERWLSYFRNFLYQLDEMISNGGVSRCQSCMTSPGLSCGWWVPISQFCFGLCTFRWQSCDFLVISTVRTCLTRNFLK
jgi:hypothetical protein